MPTLAWIISGTNTGWQTQSTWKEKRETQHSYEKTNKKTSSQDAEQLNNNTKRIKRVMDAPTYSLNQKLNINKNIYGNFHSLLYVSILVPFCPFSNRFLSVA